VSEYECGYCGGAAVDNPDGPGMVHAEDGVRIASISSGDFVSAAHNRAGTRINPVDLVESGEGEA
jgi:hypothetical protein